MQRLTDGLWRWTARHPEWHPGEFGAEVACFAAAAEPKQFVELGYQLAREIDPSVNAVSDTLEGLAPRSNAGSIAVGEGSVWFVSGIVMMYWTFPDVSAADLTNSVSRYSLGRRVERFDMQQREFSFGGGVSTGLRDALAELKDRTVAVDPGRNDAMTGGQEGEIGRGDARLRLYVIPTNEELLIARDTIRCILDAPRRW